MAVPHDRVAVVTGASRGIGAAIARRLADDGFKLAVNYSSSPKEAADLVREIEERGGRALPVQADVGDPVAVRRLFDQAEATFGTVDVLVNNAGIMTLAPIASLDDATFDRMIITNLKGVFNGLREAANRLNEGGRIVSFSSSVIGLYQPTYGVYAATKAAVEAMTHILAKELGTRGITVNAVAPGPIATDLFLGGKEEPEINRIRQMIPLGRLGDVEDIAGIVSFLAGPDGGWVNGQIIRANGGIV